MQCLIVQKAEKSPKVQDWNDHIILLPEKLLPIVRCNFKELGIAIFADLVAAHLYSGKSDTQLAKNFDRFTAARDTMFNCKKTRQQ